MPNNLVPVSAKGLLNRRLFFAAGSAGAVFGALTKAADAAPAISPELQRLVEAHKQTLKIKNEAAKKEDEIRSQYKAWRKSIRRGSKAFVFGGIHIEGETAADCKQHLNDCFDYRDRDVFRMVERVLPAEAEARMRALFFEARVERLANIDKIFEEFEAKERELGVDASWEDHDAAVVADNEALTALLGWRCVSVEDIRFKAAYLSSIHQELDFEDVEIAFRSFTSLGQPAVES
ncbi:hypothetical protein RZS28_03980 [Methylocapsa polymorpha]|uniref:TraB/GumN family protein n=1 Tax=Methylocapsa polymorpha TaxID=3080828 RepID=A0ABZ0HV81_9HYPH|nr:hypothetical protein RZS28_03980 [Methylocapsa sp. RX1]